MPLQAFDLRYFRCGSDASNEAWLRRRKARAGKALVAVRLEVSTTEAVPGHIFERNVVRWLSERNLKFQHWPFLKITMKRDPGKTGKNNTDADPHA
jgi:hypothetical protein